MKFNRRSFVAAALSGGTAAVLPRAAIGQFLNAPRHGLPGTLQERYAKLDAVLKQPVFKRELFKDPVIIESIELLRNKKEYLCRVRSKDGHEGISVSNAQQMAVLYPLFVKHIIWRSKINLSFLTHSNQDEFVHKSFEIAGCGGFLLAERSEGHLKRFREDEEAVLFSNVDELATKIRRYLPDEQARARIAAAGQARALRDGYHNDRQVGLILERAESIFHALQRC